MNKKRESSITMSENIYPKESKGFHLRAATQIKQYCVP